MARATSTQTVRSRIVTGEIYLQGPYKRWDAARLDFNEFVTRMDMFVREHIAGMIVEDLSTPMKFFLAVPRPDSVVVQGFPRILVGRIVEGLLSALDMAVFHMARKRNPGVNEKHPKFVIADDRASFNRLAKRAFNHLAPEVSAFVEALQPYHGNPLMGVLRDARNQATHRDLLKLANVTDSEIVIASVTDADQYREGWWRFPTPNPSVIVVVRRGTLRVSFLENQYEATGALRSMVHVVRDILTAFERHLHGYRIPTVVHGRPKTTRRVGEFSDAAGPSAGALRPNRPPNRS